MKTITVTDNLPLSICTLKLQNEIRLITPDAIVQERYETTLVSRAIIISNVDDLIQDQTIIDLVVNHDCGQLWHMFPSTDLYRTKRRKLIDYVTLHAQELTTSQLKEASVYFATPTYVRDMFFTIDEQIILGEEFNKNATEDRQIRHGKAMSELMNFLTYAETIEIVNDLGNLSHNYITYGIEGTSEGDPVGLFDYFESTEGTQFENNGFLEKTFTPRNDVTIAQLSARIMQILKITV